MVLKSHEGRERGVLLIDYNFAFSLFTRFFDVDALAKDYFFVLAPSWTGMMVEDVLIFANIDEPVICMVGEDKDERFLRGLNSSLVPIRVNAAYLCDHRVFAPLPSVAKEYDIVAVCAWGKYKRHRQLLKAIAEVKQLRGKVSVALVGYPADMQLDDIKALAHFYGLKQNVSFFEKLTPAEVNVLYNKSTINVLWSRREGTPRVLVEGMMAGVRCVLQDGFNYGGTYPHVSPATGGCFASETSFAQVVSEMLDEDDPPDCRRWVLENMSPQVATREIGAVLKAWSEERGLPWTREPVEVCGYLNTQQYWEPQHESTFAADFQRVKDALRRG